MKIEEKKIRIRINSREGSRGAQRVREPLANKSKNAPTSVVKGSVSTEAASLRTVGTKTRKARDRETEMGRETGFLNENQVKMRRGEEVFQLRLFGTNTISVPLEHLKTRRKRRRRGRRRRRGVRGRGDRRKGESRRGIKHDRRRRRRERGRGKRDKKRGKTRGRRRGRGGRRTKNGGRRGGRGSDGRRTRNRERREGGRGRRTEDSGVRGTHGRRGERGRRRGRRGERRRRGRKGGRRRRRRTGRARRTSPRVGLGKRAKKGDREGRTGLVEPGEATGAADRPASIGDWSRASSTGKTGARAGIRVNPGPQKKKTKKKEGEKRRGEPTQREGLPRRAGKPRGASGKNEKEEEGV